MRLNIRHRTNRMTIEVIHVSDKGSASTRFNLYPGEKLVGYEYDELYGLGEGEHEISARPQLESSAEKSGSK